MFLRYNGIDLQVVRVLSFSMKPIYDGSGAKDYLYTHYRIAVSAIFNPGCTFIVDGDGNPTTGPVTVQSLAPHLLRPRRDLKFSVPVNGSSGETILVETPLTDANGDDLACDAANGPTPIRCDIIKFQGERTCTVEFEVETWVQNCQTGCPLISHRWETSADISTENMTTRTTSGEMIFRTDFLSSVGPSLQISPDAFRGTCLPICPAGFQRTGLQVTLSKDNSSLRYSAVDEEVTLRINPRFGVTRIKGTFTKKLSWSGNILEFAKRTCKINIRVWGLKTTTRSQLVNAIAYAAATYSFFNIIEGGGQLNVGYTAGLLYNAEIIVDLFDKYAEGLFEFQATGTDSAIATLGGALGGYGPFAIRLTELPENIAGLPAIPSVPPTLLGSINPSAPGIGMTRDSNSRGTYVAHLLAQALQGDICTQPPSKPQSVDGVAWENRNLTYTTGT